MAIWMVVYAYIPFTARHPPSSPSHTPPPCQLGCLQDLDLDIQLQLPPGVRQGTLGALARDAAFLEARHVMDYSLLVGVVEAGLAGALSLSDACSSDGLLSLDLAGPKGSASADSIRAADPAPIREGLEERLSRSIRGPALEDGGIVSIRGGTVLGQSLLRVHLYGCRRLDSS